MPSLRLGRLVTRSRYAAAGVTIVPLLAAARPAGAQLSLDVEAGVVWADKNNVQVPGVTDLSPGTAPGTRLSLTDEVPDERAGFVRARVSYRFGPNVVSVLAAPLRIRSEGAAPRAVTYNGVAFAAGAPLVGRYDFSTYRLTYRYTFVRRAGLRLGAGVTGVLRDAFIELEGPSGGAGAGEVVRTRYSNRGIVPPLLNVDVDARVAGPVRVEVGGDLGRSFDGSGRLADALAALSVDLTRSVRVRAGYRILEGAANEPEVYNVARLHFLSGGVTVGF